MDERETATHALPEPAEAIGDSWLDRALEDSFPASDPIAAHLFD
jgi:hypothetical protein